MKKFFVLLLLLIMIFPSVAQEDQTVWSPGNDYKIGFLHSAKLMRNGIILTEFLNLPVTEFTVNNFTNSGYDFYYWGYDNITYKDHVEFIQLGGLELPIGGFPILFPIMYKGVDKWPEYFASEVEENFSTIIEVQEDFAFGREVSRSNNLVSFSEERTLNIEFKDSSFTDYFSFIDLSAVENDYLPEALISTNLLYTVSTGALFQLNYTISYDPVYYTELGINQFYLSEQLDFVAIFPYNSLLQRLDTRYPFLSLIIIPLILRRQS
ncbi:MAG: hypothetical protein INQ03_11740 [Candidatus Heimdallarchaeota archaeon]|nr:hypothetical protein [Candidatus Heimdallarchaeota archaeon]